MSAAEPFRRASELLGSDEQRPRYSFELRAVEPVRPPKPGAKNPEAASFRLDCGVLRASRMFTCRARVTAVPRVLMQ